MPVAFRLEYVEQTGSTNDDLKRRAKSGEPEGLVLVAERQNGGRGRLGRTFHSPALCGLYASVLLRPHLPLTEANRLTCYTAVVLFDALCKATTGTIGIKWVNDIYRNSKKVCGILTESAADTDGQTAYAVVGFGVNLLPPADGFPADIATVAGSVFDDDADFFSRRETLLSSVLDGLSTYESALLSGSYMHTYRAASILHNAPVTVWAGSAARDATALDVDAQGRLHVRYADGTEAHLGAGDVSIRLRQGASV